MDPQSRLTPMPLTTRVRVGRVTAATLGVLVLLGGVIGVFLNQDDLPFPAWVLAVLVALLAGLLATVAFARWDAWLHERGQEAVLTASMAVPAAVATLVHVLDDPGDVDSLLFTVVIVAASALTVGIRRHILGVLLIASVVAVDGVMREFPPSLGYVLAILGTVAVLGALAAGVIGSAVADAARGERDAEAASRALRAVVDAARTATTSEGRDVLEAVVTATARLQSDTAGAYLLHPDGQLRYGATFNIPEHLLDEAFPADRGMAGQALQADRTLVTGDYLQYEGAMAEYQEVDLRAAIASPIRVQGEPVGVLVAGRYRPGGYQQAAVTAFELLADHAGRALELSQAIDEDRRVLERLKSLHALQEDFVATVSHELRTPLTVIDGLAETLERRGAHLTQPQVDQLLSRLRANTTTLATIVTSLLEAARLDRGLVEFEEQVVDLWALIEGCVARLSPILHEHELELDLDDALVLGDNALLERVIDNLLTNAQRHTPPGTTVRIETRLTDTECVLTISDDGPGIAQPDLERITDRFTRGGDLHTRTTRGLGLGLALADQVLRLHGTRLHVESPPDTGAQFRFRLRLADA